jgi:peptide/nickel transport system substrate-binding protein
MLAALTPKPPTRGRRGRKAVAGLLAGTLAAMVTVLASPAGPSPARAADPVTFTVALTGDVDSLSPFLGVEANSYEMWALMYDFLVGYKMTDMSPQPALAESWDTSDDGLTWTFHMRDGVKWSDGQPLTAADVAYTYNRVLTGKVEGNNWESYLNNVSSVTAPDATTVVLQLSKPNAVLPLLPIPIVPEHIWKDVDSKSVKNYANEPTNGQPVVGSGPFRLVEGTAGGSTFRFETNPDYWGGAPHVDQVVYQVYKAKDPAVQALIKGEVDFVEDITPLQVKSLQDQPGITAHEGVSPLFEEIGFNTGAVDTDTGKPIGDGNPALLDPKFRHALGYAVDTEQIVKTAYQGAAKPGTTIVPSAYSTWHWTRAPRRSPSTSTRRVRSSTRPATRRARRQAEPCPTARRSAPCGSSPRRSRSTPSTPWTCSRVGCRSSASTPRSPPWTAPRSVTRSSRAPTTRSSGTGTSSRTRTASWPTSPATSGAGCPTRGTATRATTRCTQQQNGEIDEAKRVEIVHQMQQQLYEDAPYIVTAETAIGEAVRNDRFACFQPQPDPGGVWLSSTAPATTRCCGRPTSAATATASPRRGRSETSARRLGERLDHADRGRRVIGLVVVGRRHRAAAASVDRGRARMTTRGAGSLDRRRPGGRTAAQLRPLRPAKVGGASAAWSSCWS